MSARWPDYPRGARPALPTGSQAHRGLVMRPITRVRQTRFIRPVNNVQLVAQAQTTIGGGYDGLISAGPPAVSAWWKLADPAGSATAADSSGNGHTGTAASVTFGVPGPVKGDTAASFNGTSSGITTTYDPGPLTGFTIEAWVNLLGVSGGTSPRIVANSHTDSDNKGFELMLHSSGLPQLYLGNGTSNTNISGATPIPATGWVYLAGTWNGTTMILYVNGVPVASSAFTGPVAAGLAAGISIGYNATYSGDYLAGEIGEVAVYPAALTAAQITARFNASTGGTAQVRLGPSGIGVTWFPYTAAFSTSSGPSDGSFVAIYSGVISEATILNGQLYNGGGDTAGLAIPQMNMGDLIVAEWVSANPGDTATLILTGSQSVLSY
jgi:hypothetical protein